MRRVLGWLGYAFGPLIGTAYFLFLRAVNSGHAEAFAVEVGGVFYPAILKRKCRGLLPKVGAITFGERIFARNKFPSQRTIKHEGGHVMQFAVLGWNRFLSRWCGEWGRYGYRNISLEKEAVRISDL